VRVRGGRWIRVRDCRMPAGGSGMLVRAGPMLVGGRSMLVCAGRMVVGGSSMLVRAGRVVGRVSRSPVTVIRARRGVVRTRTHAGHPGRKSQVQRGEQPAADSSPVTPHAHDKILS
jgi:hypothetical protein